MTVFEEILTTRAAEAGIVLTAAQTAQFAVYNEMLIDWNTRMNLTALTAPAVRAARMRGASVRDGGRLLR